MLKSTVEPEFELITLEEVANHFTSILPDITFNYKNKEGFEILSLVGKPYEGSPDKLLLKVELNGTINTLQKDVNWCSCPESKKLLEAIEHLRKVDIDTLPTYKVSPRSPTAHTAMEERGFIIANLKSSDQPLEKRERKDYLFKNVCKWKKAGQRTRTITFLTTEIQNTGKVRLVLGNDRE